MRENMYNIVKYWGTFAILSAHIFLSIMIWFGIINFPETLCREIFKYDERNSYYHIITPNVCFTNNTVLE